MHILAVDDDRLTCELLREIVIGAGHGCDIATSGAAAISEIVRHAYDLILCDLIMPGVGGFEVLRYATENNRKTPFIVVSACSEMDKAIQAMRLGALDFIQKPLEVAAVEDVLRRAERNIREYQFAVQRQVELETTIATHESSLRRLQAAVATGSERAITALVLALDARERETQFHSLRVSAYSTELAHALGLDPAATALVCKGALLHDIGKIGIPDQMLLKPGPLSETEWELMRKHPETGAHIVQALDEPQGVVDIVLFHHEHFDGGGYPRGLRTMDIPLGARIFAVSDAYDAITSDRPYRRALHHAEAVTELTRHSGRQFDPTVVEAFLSLPAAVWLGIKSATGTSEFMKWSSEMGFGFPILRSESDVGQRRQSFAGAERSA